MLPFLRDQSDKVSVMFQGKGNKVSLLQTSPQEWHVYFETQSIAKTSALHGLLPREPEM